MEIWLAVMGGGGAEECVIGAYSTEELAETTAERVAPGDWYTLNFALDEVPRWIEELNAEEALLRHPPSTTQAGCRPRLLPRGRPSEPGGRVIRAAE